jgi:hypothetical protein
MSNPLEEYFQEKTAASPMQGVIPGLEQWAGNAAAGAGRAKLLGTAKNVATSAAMGAGTGALAAGIGMAASKIYDAITKTRDFRSMLENNADLQQHYEQNPKYFNLAYNSLRSTSPAFGKDPIVAGHYMRRIMDDQGDAGGILMQAMKDSPRAAGNPMVESFGQGAMEGAKAGLK